MRRRVSADWGRHPGWLIGIVAYPLIMVLTVGALAIALQAHARARGAADEEARTLAAAASRDIDRFIVGRMDVLGGVSQLHVIRDGNATEVQMYLERLIRTTSIPEMGWVGVDGVLRAHSLGMPPGAPPSYTDRDFFQEVLQTRQPAIGTVVQGKVLKTLTVPLAHPTFSVDGKLNGVIVTGFRLDGTLGDQTDFGISPGLRVLDRSNHVIISDGPVTELADGQSWLEQVGVKGSVSGVRHGIGLLGEPDHVIGFDRVGRAGWLVLVDRPQSEVYGDADSVLRLELAGILTFAVIAGTGVAWGMVRLERESARVHTAERAAEESRRLRDELVAALGHDLGNPLTIIRGHAGLLRRQLSGADNSSPVEIEQAARRMQRMIQGLLDLASTGAEVTLARDEVDLVPLSRVLIEERQMLERGREFRLDAAEDHLIGEWDRMRVERVIDNLLSNAVKYSPPESLVTLRIARETAQPGEEWAVIEVLDCGIGIPELERSKVFDAFYRGANAQGQAGSGLGLASVRRVAEQHGGDVAITPRDGGGTVLRVRLPLGYSLNGDATDPVLERSTAGK